jgi:hypothetical protein
MQLALRKRSALKMIQKNLSTKPVKTSWKNAKYCVIAILFCTIAFTPLIHTFLPKKVDRSYSITDTELHEGLNLLGDGYEIEITNGKVTCFREYDSKIVNRIFGWSNWRRFLLGGSPYFCLLFLTLFCVWIYSYKDRNNPLFQKTVITVLCFFGLVSGWFTIYSLYPKPDIPYSSYYILLFIGSLLINISVFFFIRWARKRHFSVAELTGKVQRLTYLISYHIYRKYVQTKDKKEYLIETLSEYKDLTKEKTTE